uniref:Uncharacterized protein n=1 Tax=Romanomermis culicivorax TaxID=13658 RepID=A0A915KGM0_ROMCU
MPAGAVEFSLHGVRPPQSQVISTEDRFLGLVSNAKIISASINEKRSKDKCASVTLYIYSDDDIVDVNQRLIDGGYGVSNATITDSRMSPPEEHPPTLAQSTSSIEFSSDVAESPPQPPIPSLLSVKAQPFSLKSNANSRCQEQIVELSMDLDKTLTVADFPNTKSTFMPSFCSPTPHQEPALFGEVRPGSQNQSFGSYSARLINEPIKKPRAYKKARSSP